MSLVIDSSVVLAAMLGEAGGEALAAEDTFFLSIVNLAEIHTKLCERGGSTDDVRLFLEPLPVQIRSLDEAQAEQIGRLRPLTRHLGLSLGDRACLALGDRMNLPILTAEKKWGQLDLGLDIRLIR